MQKFSSGKQYQKNRNCRWIQLQSGRYVEKNNIGVLLQRVHEMPETMMKM
jgi:hypothetical protein